MTTNCDLMRVKVFTCWSRMLSWWWLTLSCTDRAGSHDEPEIFAYKTPFLAIFYLLWDCCFGGGGATSLVYDYLELYSANAQNTYRRTHKSYCSRPIHTKRCYWAVFLERIESRTLESHESLVCLESHESLYALYAKYANVLVEKRTLVKKSKILNLKPNCIYSMQSIETLN